MHFKAIERESPFSFFFFQISNKMGIPHRSSEEKQRLLEELRHSLSQSIDKEFPDAVNKCKINQKKRHAKLTRRA
jgi:hypothetical protein